MGLEKDTELVQPTREPPQSLSSATVEVMPWMSLPISMPELRSRPRHRYSNDGETGTEPVRPTNANDKSDAIQRFLEAGKNAKPEDLDIELDFADDHPDRGKDADFILQQDGTLKENNQSHGDHIVIFAEGNYDEAKVKIIDDLVLGKLAPLIDKGDCHLQKCEGDRG